MPEPHHEHTYHVLGVPLRTGSLYPGSENDAQAYRDAHLLQRLEAVGCRVFDEGDVAIPSYLPHHHIPPIKNWPGPRIAWDCIGACIAPYLQRPGHIPLLIGADCSIVVGTTQASPFRAGPTLRPTQVTVIGWSDDLNSPQMGLQSLPLAEVRRLGPGEAARQALQAIPVSAPILLHFDIDVLNQQAMPGAYFLWCAKLSPLSFYCAMPRR